MEFGIRGKRTMSEKTRSFITRCPCMSGAGPGEGGVGVGTGVVGKWCGGKSRRRLRKLVRRVERTEGGSGESVEGIYE